MATELPAADGSSPKQQKFDGAPPMFIDADKRYTAEMVTNKGTMVISLDPRGRAEDRQQLRLPGPLPLLRRHRLPPGHSGLRPPGRRPDGHRHRGPRLPLRGRTAQTGSLRARLAGDGQRRAEHQRQPVLHHQRAVGRSAARRSTPCSARSSPGLDVVGDDRRPRDAVGHAEGEGDHRVGDDHRGGLSTASTEAARSSSRRSVRPVRCRPTGRGPVAGIGREMAGRPVRLSRRV